jgi:hypothetical protein
VERGFKPARGGTSRAFLDRLLEIGRSVPDEEWNKLPKDASKRFDEYVEGQGR